MTCDRCNSYDDIVSNMQLCRHYMDFDELKPSNIPDEDADLCEECTKELEGSSLEAEELCRVFLQHGEGPVWARLEREWARLFEEQAANV